MTVMMRRHRLPIAAALAMTCAVAFAARPETDVEARRAAEPPNVVLIVADDLDTATFNRAVSLGLLPNITTALLRRGTLFVNAFVTNAVCCPSRVTLLTGQYSHNHGVLTIHAPTGGVSRFDDSSTLPMWMQKAGYRTGHVGKYLNGYGSSDANRDGVHDERDIRYIPPGWDDWQSLFEPSTAWMYHFAVNDNGTFVTYGDAPEDYQTDVIAARAVDFITESSGAVPARPFFLNVAPIVPHMEVGLDIATETYQDAWRWTIRPAPRHLGGPPIALFPVPSLNEADVSDKPAWLQRLPLLTAADLAYLRAKSQARLAALRSFDDLVGRIVTALETTGVFENTFLILTSDNGYHLGEHRLAEKLTAYEESIRVPLVVVGPGVPAWQVARQMAINTDVVPTIADISGTTPGLPVDGTSLRALWQSPAAAGRRRFLVEHWQAGEIAVEQVPSYAAVRTAATARYVPGQLYVEYDDGLGSRELYDLATDPNQLTSVHADPSPKRVFQRSVHALWLAALRTCGGGSCQALEFSDR